MAREGEIRIFRPAFLRRETAKNLYRGEPVYRPFWRYETALAPILSRSCRYYRQGETAFGSAPRADDR
jgi:hypothetical protein